MVSHCRCLSFSFREEEQEIEYETTTQVQSTSTPTQTFYNALSNFDPSVTDSKANASVLPNNLKEFTFSELKAATNNFSRSVKIGEGVFGCVYRGVIKNPQDSTKTLDVAVKQLRRAGLQGHKEWVTEVNVLGVVEHPNLVKLVGYCAEHDERGVQLLLVYEYMLNRSVEDHLYKKSEAPISWSMRLKVAQDTARGLAYLHEEMDFQIIFRDLKSSNILLDDQWNVKLSDFGLSRRVLEEGSTRVLRRLIGTSGYAAPEYIQEGHLTSKSDVWSYGVFLYELITGRPPLDWRRPVKERKLLEWVRPYLNSKKFRKIIDPRLEGNYSLKSAQLLCSIADMCLHKDPTSRPKMSEVVEMVNQLMTWVPSQAPRLNCPVSMVAIEPKMVEKTSDSMKSVGETESSKIQHKESRCFSRIWCFKTSVQ